MKKSEQEITKDLIKKKQKELLTTRPGGRSDRQRGTKSNLWCKPFHSDALGVNPEQIPEATKALRASGIMADFDSSGKLIVTSERQFRGAAKSCGLWTGRDGYGGGQTEDGQRICTGREQEKKKQEFRVAVARGDYDV